MSTTPPAPPPGPPPAPPPGPPSTSTKRELSNTNDELGTTKGAGQILGDLVRTGAKSADDQKSCTDSARTVQNQASTS